MLLSVASMVERPDLSCLDVSLMVFSAGNAPPLADYCLLVDLITCSCSL